MKESLAATVEAHAARPPVAGHDRDTTASPRAVGDIAALLVVALVLLSAIPLVGGLQSGNELTGELLEMRSTWAKATFSGVGAVVSSEPVTLPPMTELTDMPTVGRISRFVPELRAEVDLLATMLRQPVPAHRLSEAAVEIEAQFLHVYGILRDLEARRDFAYGSLLVFLLIFILGLVIVHRIHWERLRRVIAARESEQRMARLATIARARERHRIARELHDEAAQNLALAAMLVEQLEPGGVRDRLSVALERGIADVRSACDRLHPPQAWVHDPRAIITALADSIREKHPIDIRLESDPDLSVDWSDEIAINVYRIVQEAITNVVRHSGVSRAVVTLTGSGSMVELTVCDDGRGIDGAREGRGRTGMRERAELINADLTWFVPPRGGTGIRLRIARTLEGI